MIQKNVLEPTPREDCTNNILKMAREGFAARPDQAG
jgi:hypothetical protein